MCDYIVISVIIPVLNREKTVGKAIASVVNQTYADWELIVVDGGSTDRTIEIAEKFIKTDNRIKMFSYIGMKQFTAVNYGIKLARGDIVGILNSDDYYNTNAFKRVAEIFTGNKSLDVICPKVQVICDYGNKIVVEKIVETDLNFYNLLFRGPYEPARFFRKRLFDKLGPIDESYIYTGEREWLIRASLRRDVKWIKIPDILYVFRRHLESGTASLDRYSALRYLPEHYRMFKKLLSSGLLNHEQRKAVKQRWLNDSISGFLMSLKKGDFKKAAFFLTRGVEINHSWPLKLLNRKITDYIKEWHSALRDC
jgi:glycosyltransferase involved in cell wall biosynthesis